MNSKMLIGGVIAGIAFFLLGWLVYGILLADTMASYSNASCMRTMEDMNMVMIGVGNLFSGMLLSYIFSKWAGISTFMGGATAGGTIGLLMSISFDCLMYGTTTMMNSTTGMIIDIVISTVMWAVVGGILGWWMGRK